MPYIWGGLRSLKLILILLDSRVALTCFQTGHLLEVGCLFWASKLGYIKYSGSSVFRMQKRCQLLLHYFCGYFEFYYTIYLGRAEGTYLILLDSRVTLIQMGHLLAVGHLFWACRLGYIKYSRSSVFGMQRRCPLLLHFFCGYYEFYFPYIWAGLRALIWYF